MATAADQGEYDGVRVHAGAFVALSIGDTGVGMTPEVQSRLFEAFFTTKKEGRGTGLGLAVVRNIVSQLGGAIKVTSAPGKGAEFTIYLPQADTPPEAVSTPQRVASPVGRESVLVVDDAAGVRTFIRTVLQRYGYQVKGPSPRRTRCRSWRRSRRP
jgi:hypothetical protein